MGWVIGIIGDVRVSGWRRDGDRPGARDAGSTTRRNQSQGWRRTQPARVKGGECCEEAEWPLAEVELRRASRRRDAVVDA